MQASSRPAAWAAAGLAVCAGWLAVFTAYLVGTGVLRHLDAVMPLPTAGAALVAAVLAVRWCQPLPPRLALASLAVAVLLGVAAVAAGASIRDISYDGPSIHLANAMEISDGLNPVTTRPSTFFGGLYPNGLWTLQAFFITLTGDLESGKAPAWLLLAISLPVSVLALRILRGAWTPGVVLAAVLVHLNPVPIYQLTSFELDGAIYSLSVIAISGAVLLGTPHGRAGLLLVGCALVLLANAKITGLYWAGCIAIGVALQTAIMERAQFLRRAGLLLAVMAVALVVVGWRPYLTVPLETGELFGVTVDTVEGAANVKGAPAVTRMVHLVFDKTGNPVPPQLAELKWPWMLSASEFVTLFDIRSGAFGPWFGMQALGALLVAGLALWAMRRLPRDDPAWLGPFWVAMLFVSTFAFPVSWWARLVAPFWLVAVLPLAWPGVPAGQLARRAARLGAVVVVAGVAVNSAATVATLRNVAVNNAAMTRLLAAISERGDAVRVVPGNARHMDAAPKVWAQRLMEASIFPVVGPADGCKEPLFASGSVRLCIDKDRP